MTCPSSVSNSTNMNVLARTEPNPARLFFGAWFLRVLTVAAGLATWPMAVHASTVSAPTYSPAAGTYTGTQSVTIKSSTSGASIRYTTNGRTPSSTSGTVYSSPVSISTTATTLKAIAYKSGMTNSSVTSGTYTIKVATPTFSPAAGTYTSVQSVTIASSTSGSTIRYTTDGSTPSETVGTIYLAKVSVGVTQTLKVIAYKSGLADSSVASSTYTIPPVATPTFSPAGGTYTSIQSVTIASSTSGATIRYTTDGSTPTETAGTVYSTKVSVAVTQTLKAIAYKSGMPDSSVASATYTFKPAITSAATATGQVGSAFSYQITATNTPTSYSVTGSTLPTGLSVNTSTGAITGTPTAAGGPTNVTINAINAAGTGSATLAITINKEPVTFTISPVSFTYNTKAQGPTITPSVSGATYSTTGTTSATTAGSYSVTATATGNYTGTSGSVAWTIAKANPTITWSNPAAITYGTALSSTQLNATASVAGSFAYSPASGTVLNAGSQTLSVTFTPTDTTDYNTATAHVTLQVNPKSVTFTISPVSFTYNGSVQGPTITPSVSGATYTTTGTTSATTAGSYSVTATATGNYTGTSGSVAWKINPPPQAAAPVFTPAGGSYIVAQNVTMTSATTGASIRFTTDGVTTPSETIGTLYNGTPVAIASTIKLQAIAYKSGLIDSTVTQATYIITPPPIPTGGLLLWLNADTGVSTGANGFIWADQSGLGNDAIQPTAGQQPQFVAGAVNGHAVIRFNGSDLLFFQNNVMNGAIAGEIIAVVKLVPNPGNNNDLWGFGNDQGTGYYNAQVHYNDFGSSDNQFSMPPSDSALSQYFIFNTSSAGTTDGAGTWVERFNGFEQSKATGVTVSFTANPNLGNGDLTGDIAEVIVYNRVLTDAERTAVGAYFSNKYNLFTAPPAPTGVTATALSATQVSVQWLAPARSDHVNYLVERSPDGVNFIQVAGVADALSYIDTGLAGGTTYTYRVRAQGYAGTSGYNSSSPAATATTLPNGATDMPVTSSQGVVLWLRADEGLSPARAVCDWWDKSGLGNDATQTQSNVPLLTTTATDLPNGLPVVHFDGTQNQYLNLPNVMQDPANPGQQLTQGEIFAVARSTAVPGALWGWGGASGNFYPDDDGTVSDDFGTAASINTGKPARSLTQYQLYNISSSSTDWTQRFNGTVSYDQSGGNQVVFNTAPTLGTGYGGTFLTGDIAEIITYNRVLTPAERTVVDTYLSAKYAISTDTIPPTVPTGLVSSNTTLTSSTLTWTASTDNVRVVAYDVYENGTLVGSSPTTSFNLTGLNPGTTCSFTVDARDAAGNVSAPSDPLSVTTVSDTQPPTVPTGLASSNITVNSATLAWAPSTDDVAVAGYVIYVNGTLANFSTTASFNLTSLVPGTTYNVTVAAFDISYNFSDPSTPLAVTTLADTQPPSAPSNVTVTNVGPTSFTVNWAASTGNLGVASYNIYANGALLGSSTSTTFNVTGLSLGNTYNLTVVALDPYGAVSSASAPLPVTTVADTQPPSAPAGLATARILADSVVLTWNASSDNVGVSGYDIYQNGVLTSLSPTTSFTATGLSPLTTYTFTVAATDASGNASAPGTGVTVTTTNIPAFSGICLWLKADTGVTADSDNLVSVWSDQSGLGNHATQPASYWQPQYVTGAINGLPVIHFTQAQPCTLGLTTNPMSGATGGEAFAVVRRSATTSVVGLWAFGGHPNGGSRYPETNGEIEDDFATNTWYNTGSAPANSILENVHIYNVGGNATQWFQNFNGRSHYWQSGNTVSFRAAPAIGGDGLGCDFDGDFAEVIVYTRVLNDAERSSVVQYLNTKYALGLSFDTTPPTAPANLTASAVTARSLALQWTASTDNDKVLNYDILQGGTVVGTTSATSFTVTGLSAQSSYNIAIRARDASGNLSAASPSLPVTTKAAMLAPTGLTTTSISGNSVAITWTAQTTDAGIVSYNVYNNGVLAGTTTATTYTLNGLVPNAPQNITVAAVDASGAVSAGSGSINATTTDGSSTGAQPTYAFVILPASYSYLSVSEGNTISRPSISENGIAILTATGTTSPPFPLYRWQNGIIQSLGGVSSFDNRRMNKTGAFAVEFSPAANSQLPLNALEPSQIDLWLPDSTTPQVINGSALSGMQGPLNQSTAFTGGSLRYYMGSWNPYQYIGLTLNGLSDDNRVWFTDIDSASSDLGGFFQATVNGQPQTFRFADLVVSRSYYSPVGGGRTSLDSTAPFFSWPPPVYMNGGWSYNNGFNAGSDWPGRQVQGVSGSGISFGTEDGGPFYVGSQPVSYPPLYVNNNGTVLERTSSPYDFGSDQTFAIVLSDGTTHNLPTVGSPNAIYTWVDDQDRPHGINGGGYDFLMQPQTVNGQFSYQCIPYILLNPPPGWGIATYIPPDMQKPEIGVVQNTATKQENTFIAFPMEIAVDANRDGTITLPREGNFDQTTQAWPFRFWVNDGADGYSSAPGESTVQDDLDLSDHTANCDQDEITCPRDLENFARLWIDLKGTVDALKTQQNGKNALRIGLKWENVTGNPSVEIFQSADADGSASYLTDPTGVAENAQVHGANGTSAFGDVTKDVNGRQFVDTNGIFVLPDTVWSGLTDTNPVGHFLFEGAEIGSGQLTLVLVDQNNNQIAEGPGIWIDLRDIKQLYERWTVGDGNGDTPASIAGVSNARLPAGVANGLRYNSGDPGLSNPYDSNGNKYILFVHGWNLPPWEKDAFAETALKRLYWQGYKGKFGTFEWPTTYTTTDNEYFSDAQEIAIYDDGEFSAWQSAAPLKRLLTTLHGTYGNNVYLLAHSMGNVVAGEALRIAGQSGAGQLVNTYVASQAAVPGHCYDPALTGSDLLSFYGGVAGPSTANIYNNWMMPPNPAMSAKANFYNMNDYALHYWQGDQMLKPDIRLYTYYYKGSAGDNPAQDLFGKALETFPAFVGAVPLHLGDANNVQDRYQIMAYAAEPRSKALGGVSDAVGFAPSSLQGLWPPDNLSSTHDYSTHPWHSAEFRFTNADQQNYWHALLGQNGFDLLP